MKTRHILVWVFILAVVGAAWLLNAQLEQRQGEETAQASRLTGVEDTNQVVSLEFSGQKYPEPLRLERRAGQAGWQMVKPLEYPADQGAVRELLGSLAQAQAKSRLEEHGPLADYGLEPPQVRLELGLAKGTGPVLLAGDLTPSRQGLYLARPGESAVLLAEPGLARQLERGLNGWRDKTVLAFEPGRVLRVELALAGQAPVVLERRQGGDDAQWTWQGHGPADPRQVEELLYQLKGLRALDFKDQGFEPAQLGLAPARGRISLALENGGLAALELGQAVAGQAQVYARRPQGGPLLLVDSQGLEALARQTPELLDRRLLTLNPAGLRGLVLSRPGLPDLEYAQEDGQWRRVKPAGGPQEGQAGQDLAGAVCRLTWEKPLPSGDYGLDNPQAVLTLRPARGQDKVLRLGRLDPASGLLAAQVEGEQAIFGLKTDILKEFPASPAAAAGGRSSATSKGSN